MMKMLLNASSVCCPACVRPTSNLPQLANQQALYAIDREPRPSVTRPAGLCASVAFKDVISREPFCVSASDEVLVFKG